MEISEEEYNDLIKLRDGQGSPDRLNPPFTQFYNDNLAQIQWLIEKKPTAASIWFFLVRAMDDRNLAIVPQTVLMDQFNISRASVARAIAFLRDNGFLVIHKVGSANAYSLNHELVWRRSHTEKQYAFDTANIIFAMDEQKGLPTFEQAQRRLQEIGAEMAERDRRLRENESPVVKAKIEVTKQLVYAGKAKVQKG